MKDCILYTNIIQSNKNPNIHKRNTWIEYYKYNKIGLPCNCSGSSGSQSKEVLFFMFPIMCLWIWIQGENPDLYNYLYVLKLNNFCNIIMTAGNSEMKTLLQPCCVGLEGKYFCGSVDKSGVKKYSVCSNPELSFFWDDVHPVQNGWKAVYYALRSTLNENIHFP